VDQESITTKIAAIFPKNNFSVAYPINIINTCSIDGFLMALFVVSKNCPRFQDYESSCLEKIFVTLRAIASLIGNNDWALARLEWLTFHQKIPSYREKGALVYNCFLDEYESFYSRCASLMQEYEFVDICSNPQCKLQVIEGNASAFILRLSNIFFVYNLLTNI
jgi:hypothetical protein